MSRVYNFMQLIRLGNSFKAAGYKGIISVSTGPVRLVPLPIMGSKVKVIVICFIWAISTLKMMKVCPIHVTQHNSLVSIVYKD